jgi:hypothetical protein
MNTLKINLLLIRAIGVYQVLFGLLGITVTFRQGIDLISNYFIILIIFVAFFSFSIYSGVVLLTRNILKGLYFSTINQLLQVVQFSIIGNSFEYVAGIYFALGFSDTPSFNLIYKFAAYKSTCYFSLFMSNDEIKVMVNLIALFLVVYLNEMRLKWKRRRQTDVEIRKQN